MLYNAEEIITTCVNVIARNFSYIYNANYNILPYRYVVSLGLSSSFCVLSGDVT